MMDRMFHRIMRGLVDTGRPPHYAELARALGLTVEEGRQLLHAVMAAYPIGWLHPETDYIASFPPLNGLPTQPADGVRGHDGMEQLAPMPTWPRTPSAGCTRRPTTSPRFRVQPADGVRGH